MLVQTRDTEASVAGPNAATNAVGTRVQSTEVNQLSTRRPCKSRTTAAGEGKSVCITGSIVLAGR